MANGAGRLMSFALTIRQVIAEEKTVTRRNGWSLLKPGDRIWACEKCMGLKKGEKVRRLKLLEIVSVRRERLSDITPEDCVREGFPDWTPAQFVAFYCQHNKVAPDVLVNRIEFRYVQERSET